MDPMARRMMWNYIMRVVTQNRACAMILTTHRCATCTHLTRHSQLHDRMLGVIS